MKLENDPLAAFWMPFTANRAFKATPRQLKSAKDMHYTSDDGRQILDGTAGLWAVNAGHCRAPIVEAIQKTAAELDYAPPFQLGHPLAFELASRIAAIMPEGLDRIFFTNSGSESVDTALKIALAYQRAIGQGTRTRLIGRERGYNGVGFGGISVGGIVNNRRQFGTLLTGVDHLPHTHNLEHNAFTKGRPEWGGHLADNLEAIVALHGAETIAAVIVEPMAGSTGVLVPPIGYLEKLREITRKHGIVLIFDEVITAFGRVGGATASGTLGVMPDIITMAKGLTNAAVPMGAVAVSRHIHDGVVEGGPDGIELFHGYTYSGHPLAAAAGLATLDLYKSEGIFENAASLHGYWQEAVHSLKGKRHIIDIRNMGIVAAIELEPHAGGVGKRGVQLFHGYTYSGHPLAAAAGLATLDLYKSEGIFEHASSLHGYWQEAAHSLKGRRHVIDIRNMGIVAAIELEPHAGGVGKRGMQLFHKCFDNGLLVRATGDIIALSPPLILEKAHIDEMVGRIAELVETVD